MSRHFAMSSRTPDSDARAGTPTGAENSPSLDERADIRNLLPVSPADAINATSTINSLQGDVYEHVERTPPLGEGGNVPPFQHGSKVDINLFPAVNRMLAHFLFCAGR
jgi:hypothetical protein